MQVLAPRGARLQSGTGIRRWNPRTGTDKLVWDPFRVPQSLDGSAQRLKNGNTLIMFGANTDPTTLLSKNPQTFTLVEADANTEAGAVAVLDIQIPLPPGTGQIYRALPVEALFGEVPGKEQHH